MKREKLSNPIRNLPLRRSILSASVFTFLIAILMTGMSVTGLAASKVLYSIQEQQNGFVTTDIINLIVVLPLLIGGYRLTYRGYLVGLVLWIGSLFVINYHYLAYAASHVMAWQLVVYVIIIGLAIWAIFQLILAVNLPEIKEWLSGAVPVYFTSGILILMGLMFFLRAGQLIIKALGNGNMLPPTEFADLLFSAIWIFGGIILWQKKAVAYVIGAGLILQASILFFGLLIYFILQPMLANEPFPLQDFIVIFFMGWFCYVPTGLILRGIIKKY